MPSQVNPIATRNLDATDLRYYQEFIDLIHAPWTTAAFNGDLWTVIIPQLAHDNETLRFGAMAIGALSKWLSQMKLGPRRVAVPPSVSSTEEDMHYFNAIDLYCRALRSQNQKASFHDAIILSVLLLFFELLRGNRLAALDHINHGLALLLILSTDGNPPATNIAPDPLPLLRSLADVFTYLAPQARLILRGKVGHSPPVLPNFTNGLKRQNQTMMSFMIKINHVSQYHSISKCIPMRFTCLDDFEHLWISFQREQLALGMILQEVTNEALSINSTPNDFLDTFHSKVLGHERLKIFCEGSREVLEAFNTAFLPLFDSIMISDNKSSTYLRALYLRLQQLGTYMLQNPLLFIDMELLRSQTPLFREYLSLADVFIRTANLQSNNQAHRLSLQCVLALHLLSIALHCRDPLVRDQAVWILKDYPAQDGLFNTDCLYAIAERNRVIEKINASEGTPAEQLQRLWRREFIFENGGDRIVIRYMDRDNMTNLWHLVEEYADTPSNMEQIAWKRKKSSSAGRLFKIELFE